MERTYTAAFTQHEQALIHFYLKEIIEHTGFAYDHQEGELQAIVDRTKDAEFDRRTFAELKQMEREYNHV
jgi:hypothetical protein